MQKLMIWCKIVQRKYLLLTFAVIVGFFISKVPYLTLPFFWDEAWVYGPAVRLMANTKLSLLPDALPVGLSRGHPLLFHFLNAAWIRIFGDSLEVIHLFNLLIACTLVFFIEHVIMTIPYAGFVEGDKVFSNICDDPEEAEYYIITNYDTNEQFTAYRNDQRLLLIKQFQFGDARTELYRKKPVYFDN